MVLVDVNGGVLEDSLAMRLRSGTHVLLAEASDLAINRNALL